MIKGKFYAVCLLLACLSAAMLGYSCATPVSTWTKDITRIEDFESVAQERTIEAQGSYTALNDRMMKEEDNG